MQIGKKQTKSIEEYRHNIKLLKYHLKKQERIHQTLKYKQMKVQKKNKTNQKHIDKPKDRIYQMSDTVIKLNMRLKQMGLNLGDIFRMADSSYQGQISKEQFTRCVNQLHSDIDETLVNQLFYAIDSNLNGILDEDQYKEFLCAYGGADTKDARRFQKRSLEKMVAYLKKKGTKPQDFIIDLIDPIKVYELKKKLNSLGMSENQTMILLKAFDPANQGQITHELFLHTLKNVKQKNEQELVNQQMEKDIKELCVQWREQNINPIKIFQEADIDKKDGVSPLELQQAFKKLMPGQTSFQIKKWVSMINLNNDRQITRQQYVNSIRSFYSLNQLDKFSTLYEKQNPKAKKAITDEDFPMEKIIQQLSNKIQDSKMTKKQVFQYIDINKNGSLDKEQLVDGLKKIGLNLVFIGRVVSVFDRDSSGDIAMDEWLHILGEDVEMEKVDDAPQLSDFSDFSVSQEDGDKRMKAKAKVKAEANKKPLNESKNKDTFSKQKSTKDSSSNKNTNMKSSSKGFNKKEQNRNESNSIKPSTNKTSSAVKVPQKKFKAEEEQEQSAAQNEDKNKKVANKKPVITKTQKQTSMDKKKQQHFEQSKKVNKIVNKVQEVKVQKAKIKSTKSSAAPSQSKQKANTPKPAAHSSKKNIQQSPAKPSKQKQQEYDQQEFEDNDNYNDENDDNSDKISEVLAIQYKKHPRKVLSYFKKSDTKQTNTVPYKQFYPAMKSLTSELLSNEISQIDAKLIYESECIQGGNKINYKDWLDNIGSMYAEDVQNEETEQVETDQQKTKSKNDAEIDNAANPKVKHTESKMIASNNDKDQVCQEEAADQHDNFVQIKSSLKKKNRESAKNNVEAGKIHESLISKNNKNILKTTIKRGTQGANAVNQNQFLQLASLIVKPSTYVKEGYKFHDFIKCPQQMKKLKQQYLPKAQALKKSKKKYVDKDFPATLQSITDKPKKSNIANATSLGWKHYSQVFNKPVLFEGSIQPGDIKQGGLGNCYLLSALACLAEYSNLIERLFEYFDLDQGYFLIWMCLDGEWKLIELDGNIVVDRSGTQPAFSRAAHEELWVIMLQKAYAKAYGNYERIVGGLPYEAIKDLSGSPGQSMKHTKFKPEQLWTKLVDANKNKQIMAAGTEMSTGQVSKIQGHQEGITKEGIVLGHAYSILDIQQVGSQQIIQLRNPWGKIQWTGDWSDKSSKWTNELKKKFNYSSNAQDGIFWMPFNDFFSQYGTTSINFIRPTFHYISSLQIGVKAVLVKFPPKSFTQGFFMMSQKDHRHEGLPVSTPYVFINIISFVCKKGKVIRKVSDNQYLYQREASVQMKDLQADQQPMIIAILDKQVDLTLAYYGNQPVEFETSVTEVPKYLEGIAFLDVAKGQQMGTLKVWMSDIGDKVFLCLQNLSDTQTEYMIETPEPRGLKIEPPQGSKNKLVIPTGQIKSIKGRITDRTGFNFGSISY